MPKRDYIDFQARTHPLAYLITFRCYGTWLPGEDRGSIDRRSYNRYGTPDMPPNKRIRSQEEHVLKTKPISLSKPQRAIVASTISEVCEYRKYDLHAINVRTNHVHAVVTASAKPEHVMDSFKAYATRNLRRAQVIDAEVTPWARHGSTRYLWTEEELTEAIEYVMFRPRRGTVVLILRTSPLTVALSDGRASDTQP